MATRILQSRPGSFLLRQLTSAEDIIEIRPETGLEFGLILNDDSLEICDENGRIVHTEGSVPWDDAAGIWVEPFREKTYLGSEDFCYVLTYDEGSWSFAPIVFADSVNGELAQPYWAFEQNITVQPSATTGTVTLTASRAVWSLGYVGLRVRYGQREISVSEYVSPTVIRGTVVSELPPSFDITLDDASHFRVGDTVTGRGHELHRPDHRGFRCGDFGGDDGLLRRPRCGEDLSSPSGSAEVTVKTPIAPPHPRSMTSRL